MSNLKTCLISINTGVSNASDPILHIVQIEGNWVDLSMNTEKRMPESRRRIGRPRNALSPRVPIDNLMKPEDPYGQHPYAAGIRANTPQKRKERAPSFGITKPKLTCMEKDRQSKKTRTITSNRGREDPKCIKEQKDQP
ncbi:hypothetical protein H0E87_023553 [Populus deltoides]|uniref:Uncharacterized protein n=1 Tax=Populus deltoides TaxID=3696 RepID=A0A8T2XGF6_POPDE|nr:hypothetical protein H0E87_023553 [Populus deltoides]